MIGVCLPNGNVLRIVGIVSKNHEWLRDDEHEILAIYGITLTRREARKAFDAWGESFVTSSGHMISIGKQRAPTYDNIIKYYAEKWD